ncbi:MAG: alpha/beta hydrolase family protein [Pirellulales bacterium]|nr:alpha/beta hydrolase family protein [Pirellulales bacterium]
MSLKRSATRWLLLLSFVLVASGATSPGRAAEEPQATTGTVKYAPPADEQGIPDFFRLPAHTFDYTMKPLASSSSKIAVSEVTFPSPIETPHPNNNTVHTEFFRPKAPGKYPGVIVLHILGGDFDLARLVARQLATNNVAALFLKLPYYGPREQPGVDVRMISPDPRQTVLGFKQAVVDIRQAAAWLEAQPEIDPEQLGITGISLGGITGALAFTAEPRFKKAFLMLAGGDIARISTESTEAKEILGNWTAQGGTLEELFEIIRPIDPVTYGSNVRGRQVVMFNASHDEVVPPACTEALWHAFGEPEIKWVDAGHYTAARYILGALTRCTKLFQEPLAAAPLKKAG